MGALGYSDDIASRRIRQATVVDAPSLVNRLLPLAGHIGSPSEVAIEASLPALHWELPRYLNGFTVQGGTLRMFGVGRGDELDLNWWNAAETWRFAWNERVQPFVFFAATAWGDQYAYRRMPNGQLEPHVYFLEATMLRAERLAESFAEFAEHELLRVAVNPYDSVTIQALEQYGAIEPGQQWAFAPSIALGGAESLDRVLQLPSRVAMTFAGDIASALEASARGSWPTEVQPWQDDLGRQRLRLRFGT